MLSLRRVVSLSLLLCAVSLYAQEEDTEEPPPVETDWSRYITSGYSRGDQTFGIALGGVFPLFYMDQQKGALETKMNIGGLGALYYNYFLGSHLFWGIELTGAFCSTVAKANYFIVPFGARIGYQFVVKRFEFPLSLMIGMAPQQYQTTSYFGLFAKPAASVFFRFNSEWSFGVTGGFWWVPQWTGKERAGYRGSVSIHGFFAEANIGVRYHF